MINRMIGAGCFVLGLLIIIGFPWISRYQPEGMTKLGIIIGILLIIAGIYLMKV